MIKLKNKNHKKIEEKNISQPEPKKTKPKLNKKTIAKEIAS
jgi:hypothetical protein